MKLIILITVFSSLAFTLTSHSNTLSTQPSQPDRVIMKDGYLILANEPGLIECPNLNCDIPVDLRSFRKEEDKYFPVSSINASSINSASHTLYQYENKIIDSFSTRNQNSAENIVNNTHVKSFDFSDPKNPSPLVSLEFKGVLIASALNANKLTNLSLETIENAVLSSGAFDECDNLHDISNNKKNNTHSLILRIIDTPLENINESHQYCLITSENSINDAAIKSTGDSIYISFSNDNRQRHVIRYKYEQGDYSFDNDIIISEDRFSRNLENYIQERQGVLMIAGDYEFEGSTQAGVKIFDISGNKIIMNSERNISFTKNTRTKSSITTLSETINNNWYVGISSDGTENNKLLNIDVSNPLAARATSSISISGNIDRIISMPNNLLSIYTSQFEFPPTTQLSIIDTSNPLKSHLVYLTSLTEGFESHPLAIVDEPTQSAYFRNQRSGRLITPLKKTLDSSFSMETSVAGSNAGQDTPSKIKIDLISIDLFKHDNCHSLNKSCWIAETFQTDTLILPYEGAESSRARSLIVEGGHYYIIGETIQFFPY